MGLKICSLFSGSTGNCTFVSCGDTQLLIDAGVALGRIEKALRVLGVDCGGVSVLVTHRHADHVAGLVALAKKYPQIVVYAHERTCDDVLRMGVPQSQLRAFAESDFYVGNITVTPVRLSHDVF